MKGLSQDLIQFLRNLNKKIKSRTKFWQDTLVIIGLNLRMFRKMFFRYFYGVNGVVLEIVSISTQNK